MRWAQNKRQLVVGITSMFNVFVLMFIRHYDVFLVAQYKHLPLLIVLFFGSVQFVLVYRFTEKEKRFPMLMMPITLLAFIIISLIWEHL
jgi:hypothetical protein